MYLVLKKADRGTCNMHYVRNTLEEIIVLFTDNFLPSIFNIPCIAWRWPRWPKRVVKYTKSLITVKMFLL